MNSGWYCVQFMYHMFVCTSGTLLIHFCYTSVTLLIHFSIQTPIIMNSGRSCVQFMYHMYGIDIDKLFVYSERRGRDPNRYLSPPMNQVLIKIFMTKEKK